MKQIQGVMLIRLARNFSSSMTPSPNPGDEECARVLSAATICYTSAVIAKDSVSLVSGSFENRQCDTDILPARNTHFHFGHSLFHSRHKVQITGKVA